MKTGICLTPRVCALVAAIGLGTAAQAEQIWNRSSDWVPGTAGQISGTPGPSGPAIWVYESVVGGGDLNSTTPWYGMPGTPLSWDPAWWDVGFGLWSAGDNISPAVDANRMAHNAAAAAIGNVPLIRFVNPTGTSTSFDIGGLLKVTWDGIDGVGRPTPVDVVIGMQNAAHSLTTVLFSTTVMKPNNFASVLDFVQVPVLLEDVVLGPGESLIITHRARQDVVPGGWIHLDDDLTITAIPSPGLATTLALGGMAVLRRRRR